MHNAGVLLAGTVLHISYHFFHSFPYEEATLVITDPNVCDLKTARIPQQGCIHLDCRIQCIGVQPYGVREAIAPICGPRHRHNMDHLSNDA